MIGESKTCQHCGGDDLPICCAHASYDDGSHDDAECVACCTRSHPHRHPAWGTRVTIVHASNPDEVWEVQTGAQR